MYAPQIVKNQDLKDARQQRTRLAAAMLDLDRSFRTSRRHWLIVIMLDPVPDGIMQKPLRDPKKRFPRS
jgi:hypothetical protein